MASSDERTIHSRQMSSYVASVCSSSRSSSPRQSGGPRTRSGSAASGVPPPLVPPADTASEGGTSGGVVRGRLPHLLQAFLTGSLGDLPGDLERGGVGVVLGIAFLASDRPPRVQRDL